MRRWLLLSYLSVVTAVLTLLEVPLGILTAHHERDLLGVAASQQATSVAVLVAEDIEAGRITDVAALARSYREQNAGELLVVDAAGRMLADSDGDGPADLARVAPDLAAARAGRNVTTTTTDEGVPVTLAAVPTHNEGASRVTGAVALALPATASDSRIRDVWYALAGFGAAMLILTAILGSRLAKSVTRPLAALESAVGRFGSGHLDERAEPSGPPELRALAQEFNRMATHIEDLLAAQSRFVADASHQLRSPLTALRLRLENLEADLGGSPDSTRPVAAARLEVQRLSRLVDGLLTLSRADGARTERRVVDVAEVIAGRVDAWGALADERGVTLAAPPSRLRRPSVALVPGDLEQILDNLLANALDATPPGRAITVGMAESDGTVTVTVTDEGPGMTEEERARAFDRFWQGPARRGGSSGLGLAIVRQLARRNGAEVLLRAAPPSAGAPADGEPVVGAEPTGQTGARSGVGVHASVRPVTGLQAVVRLHR